MYVKKILTLQPKLNAESEDESDDEENGEIFPCVYEKGEDGLK